MQRQKIDYKTLHEGLLGDIWDLFNQGLNSGIIDTIEKKLGTHSSDYESNYGIKHNIASAAKGLTATFPVLVTEATKIEHAIMISKAIERKAMALLQMLFAAQQITSVKSAQGYLRKFHHNIDSGIDISGMDVDDVIELSDNLGAAENSKTFFNASTNLEKMQHQALVNEAIQFVYEDTKKNTQYILSGKLNDVAINEYTCIGNDLKNIVVLEDDDNDDVFGNETEEERIETITDSRGRTTTKNIKTTTRSKTGAIDNVNLKNAYEVLNKSVLKTDIAKANEAVPSLLIVNFITTLDNQQNAITTTAVIGVKAVLHYVSSEDMVNHIIMKNSDKHGLFNFIRATTGEISFFRDFLFAVDRAKVDAIGRAGKGSRDKMWKVLELRADEAKYNKKMGKNNTDCAAITSLIINKSEVDLIKKYHRIDLMKSGQFLGIMRGYNLMCGVILDEVAEKVEFLFDDGDGNFETLSFMSLERDSDSGQLKKVINLMAAKGR